jgi:glycerophosphoryl diester phosphodiesterase
MPRTQIESETLTLIETRPLALAHRGARLQAPENTISAFELALEHGCNGFECDLRATADGEIVICHDVDFIGLSVAGSSYSELVTAAQISRREQPPRLDDVIASFAGRAYMDLELKVTGMAPRVLELLRDIDRNIVIVSSFLAEALDEIHSEDPSLRLAWICDDSTKLRSWRNKQCDALVLHFSIAAPHIVRELHDAQRQVLVWAAEQKHEIEQLMELGVDGIISGHTQLLAETLTRSKARAAALGR